MNRKEIIKELKKYPEYCRPSKYDNFSTEQLKDCLDCLKILF